MKKAMMITCESTWISWTKVREKASIKMTKYQQKMADYYNKRVKLRRLDIGDLVLCKVTPATRDSA